MSTIIISILTSSCALLNLELLVVFMLSAVFVSVFYERSGINLTVFQTFFIFFDLFILPIALTVILIFLKALFMQRQISPEVNDHLTKKNIDLPKSVYTFAFFLCLSYASTTVNFSKYLFFVFDPSKGFAETEGYLKLMTYFLTKLNQIALSATAVVLLIYLMQIAAELPLVLMNRGLPKSNLLNPKQFRILIFILICSVTFETLANLFGEFLNVF